MKTKTISVIAALSLLPALGFAQPPPAPPNPPNAPFPPVPPNPPKDRDHDKGPKVPVTFLGVETSEVPRVLSEQLGLARGFGLVVDYVVPDGPAAAAGVQQNDIVKMLNDQILVEPDQLAKLIRSFPEGTNVTLTILRKGQETKITVKLGKKEVSSRRNFFGPDDKDPHRHEKDFGLMNRDMENMKLDFGDMNFDFSAMENMGPSIRDAVRDARREALRASAEARREALRASGEVRREALRASEEARRAARQIHVFSSADGATKSTTIDLGKAQVVVTDPHGEMKIETVNGKKILTAKDPQGRLLFSGPVDSKEDLDKVPAEVRGRYDKLQQKDLPGVMSTASASATTESDDEDDNDSDDEDAVTDEDDDDGSEPSESSMQQVFYRSFRAPSAPLTRSRSKLHSKPRLRQGMRNIRNPLLGTIRTVISISAVLVAIAQAAMPEGSARPESSVAKEIDGYLNSLVSENKLSGAVVVAKDGVAIASKAAGVANKTTGAPITLNTKFNLGSLNKMFTAVAIAQLAQAGKVSFNDPISKYLPDYPNKEVAAKVTIHQLLTHTSGMGMYWNDKFMAQREKLLTVAAHLPLFVSDPLLFPPGDKFQYSNSGYMLLGAIIEKVSGEDYYSYVRTHIYQPAGMSETGFYEPGKEVPNLAIGYSKMSSDGKQLEEARDNTDMREVKGGPAGGGYSTVGDLVKFHMALRGYKLLNEEYTKLITTGKVEAGGPIGRYAYGFGDKVFDGKHIVGHNGGSPGIAANFEMYPELGYTAVVLMNSDPPAMMPVIMGIRQRIPAK